MAQAAWAQALNKAFERPLLVSAQGGRKGGGCVLSSEARARLVAAEALEFSQHQEPSVSGRRP